MSLVKKITTGVAVAGLSLSSLPALAAHIPGFSFTEQPFTFDATAYGGGLINASFIDFSYQAEVDQTSTGATTGTFDETGVAFFGTFRQTLGGAPIPNGIGTAYNLYLVFDATGTTTANLGGVDGVFTSFNVSIWIDPTRDSTSNSVTIGGVDEAKTITDPSNDDVKILAGNLLSGGFHVFGGLANGDFDVQFAVTSFDPTVWGGSAFAGPTVVGDLNGVNTNIQGVTGAGTTFTDAVINGSGNNSYTAVPEPASLALVGLGLVGLGAIRRRKSA